MSLIAFVIMTRQRQQFDTGNSVDDPQLRISLSHLTDQGSLEGHADGEENRCRRQPGNLAWTGVEAVRITSRLHQNLHYRPLAGQSFREVALRQDADKYLDRPTRRCSNLIGRSGRPRTSRHDQCK